jgi:hypothetical protein
MNPVQPGFVLLCFLQILPDQELPPAFRSRAAGKNTPDDILR